MFANMLPKNELMPIPNAVNPTFLPRITRIDSVTAWHFVAWVMALVPSLLAILTWDSDGKLTAAGYTIRHYGLPVTVAELVIIWISVRNKWFPDKLLKQLPTLAKAAILIWTITAFASAMLNAGQLTNTLFVTWRYLMHGVFFAALIGIHINARPTSDMATPTAFAMGAMLYAAILTLFVVLVPDGSEFPWVTRLPSATNVRQIGYYAAIMSVAPLAMILFAERQKIWVHAICFATLLAFVAWSGSRAALLGVAVGSLFALTAIRQKPRWKRMLLALGVALSGLGVSLPIPTPAPEFGLFRMVEATNAPDMSSGRLHIWSKTITEIESAPLLGHGAGTFRENMGQKYDLGVNQPHQFILQYIYDWGLVGGSAALMLLGMLCLKAMSLARENSDLTGYLALAGLFSAAMIAMIDGAFYSPLSIAIALIFLTPLFAGPGSDPGAA